MKLDTLITVIVGPIVLLVAGWWLNRRLNQATAAQAEAAVERTTAETDAVEAANWTTMLGEVRKIVEDHKRLSDRELQLAKAESAAELATARRQLEMTINDLQAQIDRIRTALSVHQPWDAAAAARLAEVDPGFPPYPPIDGA